MHPSPRRCSSAALAAAAAPLLALALAASGCAEQDSAPPAPAAATGAGAQAPGTAARADAAPAEPGPSKPHPALSVDTLDHGRFELAAQRGSWVVVNFWATWCSPCLKEIPDLSAFDARREDVTVIGLAYEEITPSDMRAFLEQHPAGYPIAIVDVYSPPEGFDTPRGLPTTHLVAPDGSLATSFLGPVTSTDLERAIAAADQGGPPAGD